MPKYAKLNTNIHIIQISMCNNMHLIMQKYAKLNLHKYGAAAAGWPHAHHRTYPPTVAALFETSRPAMHGGVMAPVRTIQLGG